MSGMGGPDEEALHAAVMAENEEHRVRLLLEQQKTRPSSLFCRDCDDPIPYDRRKAMLGCQYCVNCQPKHDLAVRPKMLYHIL